MQAIQIQTAQNVFIEYQPAGTGDRILAYLVDSLVKVAYGFVVVMGFLYGIGVFTRGFDRMGSALVVVLILLLLPLLCYNLLMEIFMDGQSIGKRAMEIKVVMLDGTQPTVGAFLLRWLLRIVDIHFFYGIVAIVAIASSRKGQRLGDMAAGTTVITLKRRVSLAQTGLPDAGPAYQPAYPQAARLSDTDMEIVRETLNASLRNDDPHLLASLAAKLGTLLGVDPGASHREFLETIVRDHAHLTSRQ